MDCILLYFSVLWYILASNDVILIIFFIYLTILYRTEKLRFLKWPDLGTAAVLKAEFDNKEKEKNGIPLQ